MFGHNRSGLGTPFGSGEIEEEKIKNTERQHKPWPTITPSHTFDSNVDISGIRDIYGFSSDIDDEQLRTLLGLASRMGGDLQESMFGGDSSEKLFARGEELIRQGNYDEAEDTYMEGLEFACRMRSYGMASNLYLSLAHLSYNAGELERAEQGFNLALQAAREIYHGALMAEACYGLGNVCASRKEPDKAIAYYRDSIAYAEKDGDTQNVGVCHFCIGRVLELERRYKEALPVYEKAAKLFRDADNSISLTETKVFLGNVYFGLGKEKRAEAFYKDAITQGLKLGLKNALAIAFFGIGNVHQIRGDFKEAIHMYRSSEALFRELGDKLGVMKVHSVGLNPCYKELGDI